MFTNKISSYYSQDKVLIEAACLSTDTKPTTGVANGSKCIEMDTGKKYMFNEEDSEWEELPSSGGGGGSSDFSTATVTVINNTEDSRLSLNIPTVCEANELGEGSPAMIYNYMVCPLGESTRKVRLYKGLAYCDAGGSSPGTTITVSGNITIENDAALITGDCTITIS